jgi:hypothetical protein
MYLYITSDYTGCIIFLKGFLYSRGCQFYPGVWKDGNIPVGNTCMFHAIFKIFSGWLTTAECRTLLKNILIRAAEILLKYLKKPSKA